MFVCHVNKGKQLLLVAIIFPGQLKTVRMKSNHK